MFDDRNSKLNPEKLGSYDLSKSPELKKMYGNCEKILQFFLALPELSVKHNDVGVFVRQQVGLETREWMEAAKELVGKSQILSTNKSRPDLARPDTISLSLDQLGSAEGAPYVTSDVIALALDKAANIEQQ